MTFHKFIDSFTEKLISLGYSPKGTINKYFYFENFVMFFIDYENYRIGYFDDNNKWATISFEHLNKKRIQFLFKRAISSIESIKLFKLKEKLAEINKDFSEV